MPSFRTGLMAFAAAAACLAPGCRDRKESISQDLEEAGFEMTADGWFRASRENNPQVLKRFVEGGFRVDTKDKEGDTALHAAVAAGALDSAGYLLKRGLSVDTRGAFGRTPLMVAVIRNDRRTAGWLLRQGADPTAKDDEGYTPLKLAVKEGAAASISELAAYDREDLDSALLLAALLGKTEVIDVLTSYGASVYARMDGDRTPLMLAAQNGHLDSARLLAELGSSRHAVDAEGRTAARLAEEAGYPEIVEALNHDPSTSELSLQSTAEISGGMDDFVAAAESAAPAAEAAGGAGKMAPPRGSQVRRAPSRSIEGVVLAPLSAEAGHDAAGGVAGAAGSAARAPVIMRHYREADLPVEVVHTAGEVATLRISGKRSRDVKLRTGDAIPGSRLFLVGVKRRYENSKFAGGKPMEVSVVEVEDRTSGVRREWISGRQPTAHDPIALVEDPVSGERYTAVPGQRFRSADGGSYLITDVRPNQIVIQDTSSGETRTIPLRGPRG